MKTKPRWRVDPNPPPRSMVDTISDGKSDDTPVWVWNNRALAKKIAGWMNKEPSCRSRNRTALREPNPRRGKG